MTLSARTGDRLGIVTSLATDHVTEQHIRLTKKFVTGMESFTRRWPGPVVAVVREVDALTDGNMDRALYHRSEIPFEVRTIGTRGEGVEDVLNDMAIVQFGGDSWLRKVPAFCRRVGLPFVFVSEYSLKTRLQIIALETANPVLRLRRAVWAWNQERYNRQAVVSAHAVQCNGTPTFDAYSPLNPDTLLYFDSRIEKDMLPGASPLEDCERRLSGGAPIRLFFSGRLNLMKGADHLIPVAQELRRLGVRFTFDIFGDGPLLLTMRKDIEAAGLEKIVVLHGAVDFESELVRHVQRHADLLVCCHPQGDPSCTYLETLACGVPILGYANEALSGLLARASVGWMTKIGRHASMAARIAHLVNHPGLLRDAGREALDFARQRTAEIEFQNRIDQCERALARSREDLVPQQ